MILRYPGSKNGFKQQLDKHLPKDVRSVASPFFGGGAYEFHLARAGLRVVGADLNGTLVNFWNAAHVMPRELANAVSELGQDMSREKFHELRKELMASTGESLYAAASFFVLNRTSYNGIMRYYAPNANRFTTSCIERLRGLEWPESLEPLRSCDAFDFLEQHPDKFWFLDPPYYAVKGGLYGLDASDHVFDHVRLARFLESHPQARWMLTYDDHPDVRDMYAFADIHPIDVHYSSRHTNKKEIVITNKKKE